jgi:hypothetical protein
VACITYPLTLVVESPREPKYSREVQIGYPCICAIAVRENPTLYYISSNASFLCRLVLHHCQTYLASPV